MFGLYVCEQWPLGTDDRARRQGVPHMPIATIASLFEHQQRATAVAPRRDAADTGSVDPAVPVASSGSRRGTTCSALARRHSWRSAIARPGFGFGHQNYALQPFLLVISPSCSDPHFDCHHHHHRPHGVQHPFSSTVCHYCCSRVSCFQ